MAQVNGGFLHYTDMKKFLKNLLLRNHLSDFEIVPWVTLFKNCSRYLDPSINKALVNEGLLHHTDMKKFVKKIFSETAGQILK